MRLGLGIFTLLVLGDVIVAIIGAFFLYPLRKSFPFAKYIGLLYSCIAVDQVCRLIGATAMSRNALPHAMWWGWAGRIVVSAGIWISVLHLLRSRGSR